MYTLYISYPENQENKPEPVTGPLGWILHCSWHEVDSDTGLIFVLLSFHFPLSLVESLVTVKLAHEAVE